jgi:hypothetical protein
MWRGRTRTIRNATRQAHARSVRLTLEPLEDRTLLNHYFVANAAQLIDDINAANAAGGVNTITLTAPPSQPYTLTSAYGSNPDGATGLPTIAAHDDLTIVGNGDSIARGVSAPAFRLLDVAPGASLTLESVTLQGGLAFGSGVSAEGGAIFNRARW